MQYSHEQQKELALNAQQGDKEALQQLWESVYLLLFRICLRCYYSCKEQADRSGTTSDDFLQISYFAFLDAVKWYDPAKGCAFTAFLKYPVKNHINSLLGIRSHYRDALNYADSLNEPLDGEDSNGAERIDVIMDDREHYECAETRVMLLQLRKCLDECISKLPERAQTVLCRRYWEQKTLKETAEEVGVSYQRVRDIERESFRKMKKDKRLQSFRDEMLGVGAYKGTGLGSFRRYGSSVERAVEWLDDWEQERERRLRYFTKHPEEKAVYMERQMKELLVQRESPYSDDSSH